MGTVDAKQVRMRSLASSTLVLLFLALVSSCSGSHHRGDDAGTRGDDAGTRGDDGGTRDGDTSCTRDPSTCPPDDMRCPADIDPWNPDHPGNACRVEIGRAHV